MHCTRNLQIRYDLLACNLQVALISKIDYSLLAKRLKTEWVQTTVRHFGQNKENTSSNRRGVLRSGGGGGVTSQ